MYSILKVVARLRQGEPPNTTFTLGRTPLHCAAANSNLPAVTVLLEHGADIKVMMVMVISQ